MGATGFRAVVNGKSVCGYSGPQIRADADIATEAIWKMLARVANQNIRQNEGFQCMFLDQFI